MTRVERLSVAGIIVASGLVIALLFSGTVVRGAVPFERYLSEVRAVRVAVSFQVQFLGPTEVGSEERLEVLHDLRDIVDESIATLDRFGHADCYRWYAETVLLSLSIYRDIVTADIESRQVPSLITASRATLAAADSLEIIVAQDCAAVTAPIPSEPDPLIQRMPLA